jgi:glycine/D-amino acid oxidase-like deaminating enzyme
MTGAPAISTPRRGDDCDVAIIGGGVVGMCMAWGLSGVGLTVTVLDEDDVAHRASRGNFALVWVQGKGANLPAYSRWTQDSADLWPGFAAELAAETGIDIAHNRPGGFSTFLDDAELSNKITAMTRLHNQLADRPVPFEVLDHARLKAMLPGLGPKVVGGIYCPADGHVNSLRLFDALHESARRRGVVFRGNAGVDKIGRTEGGFRITCKAGEVRANRIVLAAGLGNARLAPMVGLHAPVKPERGEILVTEKLAPFLHHPMGTIRQTDEGGVMIGDSKEEVGFDNGTDRRVLAGIAARAVATFPLLARVQIVRSWGALRIMSPDGCPIYDRSTTAPGAYVVTCHSGVTLAAVHATVLAPQIAAGALAPGLGAFSARRFDVPAAA